MGEVVQETADALVELAEYARVQICLVDVKRKRVQRAASCVARGFADFTYKMNLPLKNPDIPIEEWNIEPWVIEKEKPARLLDASSSDQKNPTAEWQHCRNMGMKAITVVPVIAENQVIGTIHFERKDLAVPSSDEQKLYEILAEQLGVIFVHAQKLDLLKGALFALTDEVQLIDPDGKMIFSNTKALKERQEKAGWRENPRS